MIKREQLSRIVIEKGSFKKAFYNDMYCGTFTKSHKDSEIKSLVYEELKARGLLENED